MTDSKPLKLPELPQTARGGPYAGRHILIDAWPDDPKILTDMQRVQLTARTAAVMARCTVLEEHFREFEGGGLTGILLLSESHLSVHTWPELGFIAWDLFLCGVETRPYNAMQVLREGMGVSQIHVSEYLRGHRPSIDNRD